VPALRSIDEYQQGNQERAIEEATDAFFSSMCLNQTFATLYQAPEPAMAISHRLDEWLLFLGCERGENLPYTHGPWGSTRLGGVALRFYWLKPRRVAK
jgi:hypothetical protein